MKSCLERQFFNITYFPTLLFPSLYSSPLLFLALPLTLFLNSSLIHIHTFCEYFLDAETSIPVFKMLWLRPWWLSEILIDQTVYIVNLNFSNYVPMEQHETWPSLSAPQSIFVLFLVKLNTNLFVRMYWQSLLLSGKLKPCQQLSNTSLLLLNAFSLA